MSPWVYVVIWIDGFICAFLGILAGIWMGRMMEREYLSMLLRAKFPEKKLLDTRIQREVNP